MCVGNSIGVEIPKAVGRRWVYKTFWAKEKRGDEVLDFRIENG